MVKHDFIRHIAKSLFNTHLAVDLFSNEDTLKYDLAYKGYNTAWKNIWNSISQISDISLNTTTYNGLYGQDASYGYYLTSDASSNVNICRQLLGQIIKNAPSRLQNLNTYVVDASKGYYSVPLITGDSISFKLTLQTPENQHLLVNRETPVPARTYQIRINLRDNVMSNVNHADGINIIVNDTSPTYYNGLTVIDNLNSFKEKLIFEIYDGYFGGVYNNSNLSYFYTAKLLSYGFTYDLTDIQTATNNTFGVNSTNKSLKIYGYFKSPYTGNIRFFIRSRNASYLLINNNILINNEGAHDIATNYGTISMIEGQYYYITIYSGISSTSGIPDFSCGFDYVKSYPPIAFTNNTSITVSNFLYGNGTYVLSRSSSITTSWESYKAFNKITGNDGWISARRYLPDGTYNNTSSINTSSGIIYGEWLRIKLPYPIVLNSFRLVSRNLSDSAGQGFPKKFKILGRNTGSFNVILSVDDVDTFVNEGDNIWGINEHIILNPTVSTEYQEYAIIVETVKYINYQPTINTWASITEWELYEIDNTDPVTNATTLNCYYNDYINHNI